MDTRNDFNFSSPNKKITVEHKGEKCEYTKAELLNEIFEDSGNYNWLDGAWDFEITFPNAHSETTIHSIRLEARKAPCEGHDVVAKISSGKCCFTNRNKWEVKEQIFQGEFWSIQAFMLGKALVAYAKQQGDTEESLLKQIIKHKEKYGFDSTYPTGSR